MPQRGWNEFRSRGLSKVSLGKLLMPSLHSLLRFPRGGERLSIDARLIAGNYLQAAE